MATDVGAFPWYDTVEDESIEQGDLLFGFEIVVPVPPARPDSPQIDAEMQRFDVIVMTQSCDIEHGKAASLLLCPWWDLWAFIDAAEKAGGNWGGKQREALHRGNLPGYHLVNEAAQGGLKIGLGVIDFHAVYTAPTASVREFTRRAGKRLRLRPPYKEHLSQAFARFFMRVGLPVDIPFDKVKKRPDT